MIGGNVGKKPAQDGTKSSTEKGDEAGGFGDAHHAEPERHDADQTDGNLHCGLRGIDCPFRDRIGSSVERGDHERDRHQAEPDVVEHARDGSVCIRLHRLIPLLLAILCCACAASHDVPRLLEDRLPVTPAYTHIVFRAYVGTLTVSVDGHRVYAFDDPPSTGRLTFHLLELPAGSAGKPIVFDAPNPPDQETLIGARYLATKTTLPFVMQEAHDGPLRDQWDELFFGTLLFVIGVLALTASILRRRGEIATMRAFGIFTLLYGVRVIVASPWAFALGISWREMSFAEAFITYVIPIPGWLLARRLIGDGWKSTLRLQVIVFVFYAVAGVLSDVITGRPGSLEKVNSVLVVVGGINILVNMVLTRLRTIELRLVTLGACVFTVFAVNNNLSNLGIVPWDYDAEAPGFLLFVAALGYAATRAFLRGERDSMALDNELRTAREIQQSILPRSMPAIEGLRFDAGYVPATSVGGDLYSFLSNDGDGAGVLVADVAGHGVPAALIASMLKIAISSQARLASEPAAVLGELNAILRRDVRRAFVTATYLWIDRAAMHAIVSNAGHPPPLLLRGDTLLELGENGVVLGRFPATYLATATELRVGDRIVACTDGIAEARNGREEMFGEERFHALLRARTSAADVLAAVQQWRGNGEDADDLTIVMIDVC